MQVQGCIGPAEVIRILLVDDYPALRIGLSTLLDAEADMEVVAQTGRCEEVVEVYCKYAPDVTLVRSSVRAEDGRDAAAMIRAAHPSARIIVLANDDREEHVYRSFRAGAMSYLLLDTSTDEILAAVRAVRCGEKHISNRVAQKLADRLLLPDISERETEVLRLVAKGMSNKEIAWVESHAVGTIKYHVNSILFKLGVADRTQAVLAALRIGLVDLD